MDVVSRRISLTAWGRLYGFDKATTARMHHAGKLPPELQIEQLSRVNHICRLASISFAGSPPRLGPVAGLRWSGSWGRQTLG